MIRRGLAPLCWCAAVTLRCSCAQAGVWGVDPTFGIAGDYATNPALLDQPHLSYLDLMGRIQPGADVKRIEAQMKLELQQWLSSPVAELKTEALKMGFRHVESGPLVRSSYHAHEQAASVAAPTA